MKGQLHDKANVPEQNFDTDLGLDLNPELELLHGEVPKAHSIPHIGAFQFSLLGKELVAINQQSPGKKYQE